MRLPRRLVLRLVPKLCLGTHGPKLCFDDSLLGVLVRPPDCLRWRNGVSRTCVPKRSLGTRGVEHRASAPNRRGSEWKVVSRAYKGRVNAPTPTASPLR